MKITDEAEERGRAGEERFRRVLKELQALGAVEFFNRPEWIVWPTHGEPYLVEVKTQEQFSPPPFAGHGLPVYQAERYMRINTVLGLRTLLVVFDPSDENMYIAWLDVLERGSAFDTSGSRGRTPRRIYPLESFQRRPWSEPIRRPT